MADNQRKKDAKTGGLPEGFAALLIALFVAWQFGLLKQRALEQGMARYRTDLGREVAPVKPYGARDLASQLCDEAGAAIGAACDDSGTPRSTLDQAKAIVRDTLAAWRALFFPEPTRAPTPQSLALHFARVDQRYQAFAYNFDRALAGLNTSTRLQSEAYRPDELDRTASEPQEWWYGWWKPVLDWLASALPPGSSLPDWLSPTQPLTAEEQRLRAIALQAMERNRVLIQAQDQLNDFYAFNTSSQAEATSLSDYYSAAEKAYYDTLVEGDSAKAARVLHRIAAVLDGDSPDEASSDERMAARTAERLLRSPIHAGKARSSLAVLERAGFAFVVWTLLLVMLIAMGRRKADSLRLTGLALMAWAEAGWFGAVPIPPLWFGTVAGTGAALWFLRQAIGTIGVRLGGWAGAPVIMPIRQRAASAWLLPGWLLLIGLGWLVMADLSLTFHYRNRFLELEQYTSVFFAMALLSIAPLWRPHILASITWFFGRVTGFWHGGGATWKRGVPCGLIMLAEFLLVLAMSLWLGRRQYLSGEFFKLAVVFIGAWLMTHRADALYQSCWRGWLRLGWPLAAALIIIASGFALTSDFGPLLVIGLTLMTVVGGYIGFGRTLAMMALLVAGLFLLGDLHSVTAERLESLRDPFSSSNEHLARLLWFQKEAPVFGFGIGNAPWCGYSRDNCPRLPRQLQSDYTFTALIGVYGLAAWGCVLLVILMVILLQRAASPAALDFVPGDREGLKAAYLGWVAMLFGGMLLFQTLITVAGNLARFPVTGITFPFVSLGDAAMLAGTFVLALLLNRSAENRP